MGTLRAGGVCDVSVIVPVHWPSQTVPGVGGEVTKVLGPYQNSLGVLILMQDDHVDD